MYRQKYRSAAVHFYLVPLLIWNTLIHQWTRELTAKERHQPALGIWLYQSYSLAIPPAMLPDPCKPQDPSFSPSGYPHPWTTLPELQKPALHWAVAHSPCAFRVENHLACFGSPLWVPRSLEWTIWSVDPSMFGFGFLPGLPFHLSSPVPQLRIYHLTTLDSPSLKDQDNTQS